MMTFRCIAFFLILWSGVSLWGQRAPVTGKITGITMVAPPQSISIGEFHKLKDVNAKWIALVPFGFQDQKGTDIRYGLDWQWWGEKDDGLIKMIQMAHDSGLKVMLKPQIYIHEGWIGDVDFDAEEEWLAWEESYLEYILHYARIAADQGVEILCIGTECKISVQKRPDFWRSVAREIRFFYDGMLTYSSNWDGYENVKIWDAVDFIGISAYFPLSKHETPTVNYLVKKWIPIKKRIKRFSDQYAKPVIFTEYGYLSTDYCAWKTWELEKQISSNDINEKAQANAYQALFKTFFHEQWWAGGFLWKWFPANLGHEGYFQKDYTPQGKLSEDILRQWFDRVD